MITEKLLQFIWQFQYYNKISLQTENCEDLQIIQVGNLNTNQGPDFLNASIKINNITLAGNIEVHTKASHWNQHNHSTDKNYKNIILHIVWENDVQIVDDRNNAIPTLVLQNLVPKLLLERYETLMKEVSTLPCTKFLPALSEIGWIAWKERLATERLIAKSEIIIAQFAENNNNWEETFWHFLAYNFGLKVNAVFFKQIAETIAITTLAKHKNQIYQLEAMLLGQANLLNEDFTNDYPILLKKEYQFLKKKFSLKPIEGSVFFLRMRPANFPTIRLAQLAMLISTSSHLFSKIKEVKSIKELQNLFNITCNDYWHYHYTLTDIPTEYEPKKIGKQMIDNIIINTIVPIVFAYGHYSKEDDFKAKAMNWLQELKPEKNNITKNWEALQIEHSSAFDSQALIELNNNYCNKKMCLQCAVGNKILKGNI
ncbi:MAG: DUF2851 family protein [Chitinophagaceae bacterium]